MRKLFFIPFLFLPLTTMAACSSDDTPALQTEQPTTPDDPDNSFGYGLRVPLRGEVGYESFTVAGRIVRIIGSCRLLRLQCRSVI